MTFTPTCIDLREHLALMSPRALFDHIEAAVAQLVASGITIAPAVALAIDELDEAVLEFEHRRPVRPRDVLHLVRATPAVPPAPVTEGSPCA